MKEDEGKIEPSLPSIYVAAHELKAPLVLMRQLALELKSTDPDNAATINRLLLTVERSLRLVDQLTKTSRLEDALFDSEPLQAQMVCRAVSEELSPLALASGQTIVTRISRRSGLAVGHRALLTALLVNLCDNAISHGPAGGSVVISATTSKEGVRFAVRDDGPRLRMAAFNNLRKHVGTGPLPMSNRTQSSGLGLWIASRFARTMGGDLTITRHHRAGMTISVLLPHSKQLSLL